MLKTPAAGAKGFGFIATVDADRCEARAGVTDEAGVVAPDEPAAAPPDGDAPVDPPPEALGGAGAGLADAVGAG